MSLTKCDQGGGSCFNDIASDDISIAADIYDSNQSYYFEMAELLMTWEVLTTLMIRLE